MISNRAGRFACALAGCLALAAAGVRGSVDAGLLDGLDVFHCYILHTVKVVFTSAIIHKSCTSDNPIYFPSTCAAIAESIPERIPMPKSERSAAEMTNVSERMENTINASTA